jgi:hypothetical protein
MRINISSKVRKVKRKWIKPGTKIKLKELLQGSLMDEKYLTSIYQRSRGYSIFINPTLQELDEAAEEGMYGTLRFIADPYNKRLIVWSADLLHSDVESKLSKYGYYTYGEIGTLIIDIPKAKVLPGTAAKKGNRYVVIASDSLEGYRGLATYERQGELDEEDVEIIDSIRSVLIHPWLRRNILDFTKFLRSEYKRFNVR